uniref:Odorant receptor n=1 Tax=Colaphellus bowringi TaxID=561076 RepID=A0A0S3J2Q6_9CUCU|nr:odorant receptor OR40 [Colaphellus bowringi]
MYEKEFRNVFWLLNFVGMHPLKKYVTPFIVFNAILTFYITVLIILKLLWDKELVAVESLCVFSQIWLKIFVLTTKKRKIKQVIDDTQQFWENDPENSENKQLLKNLAKLERIFLTYISCSTCMFLFKPLLVKGTSIYYYYKIPQIPFYVSYPIEFYVTIVTMALAIAVNLFISIVIVIGAGQFSNLNAKMKQLDLSIAEDCQDGLRTCTLEMNKNIEYHDFLIKYVSHLDEIFSMLFVVLTGIITSLLCMNMYVLSQPTTTAVDMIRCGTMVCAFTSEFLFLYGVPAQRLMDEAEEVANSAFYHCQWYLPNIIPLRKSLSFMIHRSQKSVCLSAMGFIDINRQTIVAMIKTAYSFFTFLQTIETTGGAK